jgi:hypothetical protein
MIGNEELDNARRLLQELNNLKRQLGESRLDLGEEELVRRMADLPAEIRRAGRELIELERPASNLYEKLRSVTSEFSGQLTSMGKVRGAFRQLEDSVQTLKLDEQAISKLNTEQLNKLQDRILKNKALISQEAQSLVLGNSGVENLQNQVEDLESLGASQQDINDYVSGYLNTVSDLTDEEKALLKSHYDQEGVLNKINNLVSDRIKKEEDITELLGVGGTTLDAISTVMSKLGASGGGFSKAIENAKEAMRETAEEIQAGTRSGGKLTVLMSGLGPMAKGFAKALADPLLIFNRILDSFFKVNEESVKFQRLTGQNSVALSNLNTRFATSVDYLKTATELTEQLGFNANSIFASDELAAIAEAKNLLGLTSEEAQGLALQSKVAGSTIDSFQDSLLAGVDSTNKLTKSAVAPGVVLKDVLKTSNSISLSIGSNPESLGKAAASARAFGYELSQVDQIANSLLNFESSIEAELEAQLLTGKQINLAKAREYAINNDLEKLSGELAANGATAAEFSNMSRIAQEGLANSLGMSRDGLAKSIMLQESSKNLTDEQRASVLGVTKEQLQQADVQDRIQRSIEKLSQSFAPILEALVPIVDLFGVVLNIASLITVPISSLFSLINSIKGPIGTIVGLLTAAAMAALMMNASISFGTGVAIAAASAVVGYGILQSEQSKATPKIEDGIISPDGGLVVSGPKGSIELNKEDSIVAGTNLMPKSPTATPPQTMTFEPLVTEIKLMREEMTSLMRQFVAKDTTVKMDGYTVGQSLQLSSTSQ